MFDTISSTEREQVTFTHLQLTLLMTIVYIKYEYNN